jgi:Uma2 family endonuclease
MTATVARKLYHFTVQEYEQLVASGFFAKRGRVELLGGEIVEMAAMGLPHANSMVNLDYMLKRQTPADCRVGVQIPILLDHESEPEPDLVVYRRRKRETHPTPAEILLVVEVSDSTLEYDRNQKFPRYAAGIPEAWLFDVGAAILERHTNPYEGRYRHLVTARRGESLASTTLPDVSLAVDEILIED